MQKAQWQAIAIGAGLIAFIVAIASGRLPRWMRITLVLGILTLASGGGLYEYRYSSNTIGAARYFEA